MYCSIIVGQKYDDDDEKMSDVASMFQTFFRAAEEASRALLKELGDNLLAAYVYGSLARGDYRKSSDVDLHIVFKDYSKAEEIPHTKWVGDVPVGVSPHPLYFYQTTPEWILENVETTARWEGLWELAKIIVLYDPDDLVSTFQKKITPILNNKALLKARAKLSFEVVKTEAAKVEKEASEGALDQAICHMYALGGGDSYSGAAVQVLKTVVRFSGLPLTTQRIWLRFSEACGKLDMPELQSIMEDCYGTNKLDRENLQQIVDETFRIMDYVATGSPASPEMVYELKRFKLAVTEHLERGEICAAIAYMLGGFSTNYLGLSQGGQQNPINQKLSELLRKTSGVHDQRELEERITSLQKVMDKIQREMLSG